jgi:hypothetical protein
MGGTDMLRSIQRRLYEESGSQTVEFVAAFPFIVFSFLFIWQMALAAYTLVVSEAAARDGARVAAVGGDFHTAVRNAAYGLTIVEISPSSPPDLYTDEEVTVTVKAKVPVIDVPFIADLDYTITSDATMPVENIE